MSECMLLLLLFFLLFFYRLNTGILHVCLQFYVTSNKSVALHSECLACWLLLVVAVVAFASFVPINETNVMCSAGKRVRELHRASCAHIRMCEQGCGMQ